MMIDKHYTSPRLAQLYNLDSGWSIERDFYVKFAGPTEYSVLDVACGTGLIACRLTQAGHRVVVGVDPAPAMLDIARGSPGGHLVDWITSTAQEFEINKTFDRIIMSGNAFQVLLRAEEVQAVFHNMRSHLARGGLIAFETRNPKIDWANRWDYEIELETAAGLVQVRRRLLSLRDRTIRFELVYEFPDDEVLKSESTLRFWSDAEIEHHLSLAGLRAQQILGDWSGGPFEQERSEEMVFIVEGR